jgi:hypothetical protein
MNRVRHLACACALLLTVPAAALAQHVSSGRSSAPAPVYHQSAPVYHPVSEPVYHPVSEPVYHPAPAQPVTRPANPGGFTFPQHDVNGAPPAIHAAPVHAPTGYRVAPQQSTVRVNPPHIPYNTGPYHNWRGPILYNPHRWGRWGWNHGVIWYPVPYYWGGGFWGPWGLSGTGYPLFGSVIDYDDHEIYPSYEIGPTSPGAQLLEDYGLTQTECGPPNLVVIWGPSNSVICAYPNNLVSPGNYELDPGTLTIQSLNTPPNP